MPKLSLQLRAQLEGVKELRPASDDFTLMVKLKCTSCHEEHSKWVGITPTDEVEMQGGKGVANYVMHCSFCKREGSAKFETPTAKAPMWRAYTGPDYASLCTLEFRGVEPVAFDATQGTWKCQGEESGSKWDDVVLEEGEWTEYDEKTEEGVSIMEVDSRWVRA